MTSDEPPPSGAPLVIGPAEIIPQELLVVVEGKKCWLRPRDMDVLALLAANAGRVLTRDAIFETIWRKPLDPHDRSVDVSIRRLRSRLAETAPGWAFVHTHHARGYRFEPTAGRPKRRRRPARPRRMAPADEKES